MRSFRGFTLVELLVVIIVVGILATVSVPLMRANIKRAILTEAVTAMGTIRTVERAYYAEHGEYQDVGIVGIDGYPDGIQPRDKSKNETGYGTGGLDGTYFDETCYRVSGLGDNLDIYCYTGLSRNSASRADVVTRLMPNGTLRMDKDGNIKQRNLDDTGYPSF